MPKCKILMNPEPQRDVAFSLARTIADVTAPTLAPLFYINNFSKETFDFYLFFFLIKKCWNSF
jgi:hypothetical protein